MNAGSSTLSLRLTLASALALGCGGSAAPSPAAPAAVAAPPAFDVRCGVDDSVRPGHGVADDVLIERLQPPSSLDSVEIGDAFSACAVAAHAGDEGELSLGYETRVDGTVASAGPSAGRVFTPLARCLADVMCHQKPGGPGRGELRFRVTLRAGEPIAARVDVAASTNASEFATDLLRTAAVEGAEACASLSRITPPSRVAFVVDLRTGRSFPTFRRRGAVARVTADGNRGVPDAVVACITEKLSTVAWGDKHAPAGSATVRLELSWGADPGPRHR